MDYKKFGNTLIVRLDPGEEIVAAIKEVCVKKNITLASVSAIGAVKEFSAGVYSLESQTYFQTDFAGEYEILSLSGTVSTMDGNYYSHFHISAADRNGVAVGGHLNSATVSATCEVVVNVIEGRVDRSKNAQTGLNVFDFEK